MYISRFQVSNYKSYRDSTEVEFRPGFNVVTGQNSAGKTALLEALTLQFSPNPHRSVSTIPVPGILPDEATAVRLTLVMSGKELLHVLRSLPTAQHDFPASALGETQGTMNRRLEELVLSPVLRLPVGLTLRPVVLNGQWKGRVSWVSMTRL